MDERRRNLIQKGQDDELNGYTFIPTINRPGDFENILAKSKT